MHNDRPLGLAGYRQMLEGNFSDIPDLQFVIDLVVCEPLRLAARLVFDCRPTGGFLGVPVNSARMRFSENVFYVFAGGKITRVWSVVDKAAIEAQLAGR